MSLSTNRCLASVSKYVIDYSVNFIRKAGNRIQQIFNYPLKEKIANLFVTKTPSIDTNRNIKINNEIKMFKRDAIQFLRQNNYLQVNGEISEPELISAVNKFINANEASKVAKKEEMERDKNACKEKLRQFASDFVMPKGGLGECDSMSWINEEGKRETYHYTLSSQKFVGIYRQTGSLYKAMAGALEYAVGGVE